MVVQKQKREERGLRSFQRDPLHLNFNICLSYYDGNFSILPFFFFFFLFFFFFFFWSKILTRDLLVKKGISSHPFLLEGIEAFQKGYCFLRRLQHQQ